MWILSVSKDRSKSWKSCEQGTDARATPRNPHQSEKEGKRVTFISFSGYQIDSMLGPRAEV